MAITLKNHTPSLYVFGDSFSVVGPTKNRTPNPIIPDWQWNVSLAKRLRMDLQSIAEFGTSNDWILLMVTQRLHEFKSGDIVIVQTTEPQRYWFFEDNPSISNVGSGDDMSNEGISTEQQTAIKLYWKYLHTNDKDQLRHEANYAYLNTLKWLCSNMGVKLIILPGFSLPNLFPIAGPAINGTLQTVSLGEFVDKRAGEEWYSRPNTPDQRLNHLSQHNHKIISERLFDHIKQDKDLDLTTGYLQKYLSVATQKTEQLNPEPIQHTMIGDE